MREGIGLYKGKRLDNRGWVEGYVVKVVCAAGSEWHINVNAKDPDDYHKIYPVNPETVGQYTGMKDKNENRIFEGCNIEYEYGIGTVVWDNEEFEWGIDDEEENIKTKLGCYYSYELEVVGNIHDSPDVLKGKVE